MAEDVLTKSWTPEELDKVGKDPHLSTLFMNQLSFNKQTIQRYPYAQRQFFVGTHRGEEMRFYATDPGSAEWFFQQRWGVKPDWLSAVGEVAFTAKKPIAATVVNIPQTTLHAPAVIFNGDCFDKAALGVILDSMDTAIKDAYAKLQLQQQKSGHPVSPESPGAKEIGLVQAIRDSLAKAPICGVKPVKPAGGPKKSPVAKIVQPTPERTPKGGGLKLPAAAKPVNGEYEQPFARVVVAATGKLKWYTDAKGRVLPQEMWPRQT